MPGSSSEEASRLDSLCSRRRTARPDGRSARSETSSAPGALFLDVDCLRLEQLLRNARGTECGEDDHGHRLGLVDTGDEAVCVTDGATIDPNVSRVAMRSVVQARSRARFAEHSTVGQV